MVIGAGEKLCTSSFRQPLAILSWASQLRLGHGRTNPRSSANFVGLYRLPTAKLVPALPSSSGERRSGETPLFFRRSKTLMGLDIGSSAVKAIELKPAGKGYRVAAIGIEPIPPDSIVDGAIIDGGAVADAVRRLFANAQFKAKDVAASLSGNSVIVKKITPAGDDRAGARRVHLLGSGAVHPLRHPGREPRLRGPDAGRRATRARWMCCWSRPRRTRLPTTPASSPRPAGRRSSSTSTPSPCRTPTKPTTASSPAASSPCSTPAPAPRTSTSSTAGQSVFTRDVSMGGNAFTEAVQRELGLPFELAETAQEGSRRRRRHLRGCPAGAEGDDRQRPARGREDVRLLQGDRLERPHRPHRAERRRDRASTASPRRCARGSAPKSTRFDPFRQVSIDAAKLQGAPVEEMAPVARRGRRPGAAEGRRPMIRINLLAAERRTGQGRTDAACRPAQKMTVSAA